MKLRAVRQGTAAVALATTLLVTACGGGTDTDAMSDTSTQAAKPSAPLQLWVRQADKALEAYKAIAAAFTTKTGVSVDVFGTVTDFEQKLNAAAAAKNLPDVMVQDTSALGSLVQRGLVQPIDRNAIVGNKELSDRSWEAAKNVDGQYYGVPFSAQAFILLMRQDWRTKLGFEQPQSWDDLAKLSKAMTTGDPDGDGQADTAGLLVPGSTERGYVSWYFTSYLWQAGGDYFTEAGDGKYKPAFDSNATVEALTWMKDRFCTDKSVNPASLNEVTAQTNEGFSAGTAGLYLTGPYNFGRFDKSLGKDVFEVVPLPKGPKDSTVLAEGENVYLMADAEKYWSQKLAEFLVTPEAQIMGMTKFSDGVVVRLPVNTKVDVNAVTKDPRWALTKKVYDENGRYVPSVPNWTAFRQLTADGINAMLANCSDPKAAAQTINAGIEAELQKQNVLAKG